MGVRHVIEPRGPYVSMGCPCKKRRLGSSTTSISHCGFSDYYAYAIVHRTNRPAPIINDTIETTMNRSSGVKRRKFDARWLCLAAFVVIAWSTSLGQTQGRSDSLEVVSHAVLLKPGLLLPPHVVSEHNATIAEAHRLLLQGSGECMKNCSPFQDIQVAVPRLALSDARMALLPNRKNCVVYAVGVGRDEDKTSFCVWEEQMTKVCPEVYVLDCAVSKVQNNVLATKSFSFQPHCVGPLSSDKSLASTMKHFGHTNLDILKVYVQSKDWETFGTQLESIMPPQIILQLYTEVPHAKSTVATSVGENNDRQEVNKIMLQMYNMGYRVSGIKRMKSMAQIALVAIKEPMPKMDTVLYDHAGDCPDELSIC